MPNTRRSKDQVQEKSPGLSLRKKSTNEAKDVSVARKATHEVNTISFYHDVNL